MKIMPVQDVLRRKFDRQSQIKELEFHASGACVHLGKISPGCSTCFTPDRFSQNFNVGPTCNLNCPYCFGKAGGTPFSRDNLLKKKAHLLRAALDADLSQITPVISFTGGGDPLVHLDMIETLLKFYRGIESLLAKKPWYYLYTNGLLATRDTLLKLKDWGLDEIRFHLGASNFSPTAYAHLAEAVAHIPVVTVETPAWPLHRERLFAMLPILADLGIKHLNLGEVQVVAENRPTIEHLLPDAEVYHLGMVHLYDGGLVYDLIEETIRRGYSFSVLDCGSLVKNYQTSPGKWLMHEPLDGLCAVYDREPRHQEGTHADGRTGHRYSEGARRSDPPAAV